MTRIISIVGSQGGCGKTFIGLNLSHTLSHELHVKTLFLDCNLPVSLNCADLYTGLPPFPFIDECFLSKDPEVATELPVPVAHQGIDFLGLSSGYNPSLFIQQEDIANIRRIILDLCLQYDFIILDIGSCSSVVMPWLLDISSAVVLAAEANASGVTRLCQDYDFLRSLNFSTQLFKVALNKWTSDSAVTEEWLFARLGMSASAFIGLHDSETLPFLEKKQKPRSIAQIKQSFQNFALNLVDTLKENVLVEQHCLVVKEQSVQQEEQQKRQQNRFNKLKIEIHSELLEVMDLKNMNIEGEKDPKKLAQLEQKVKTHAVRILDEKTIISDRALRDRLIVELVREILYLGPLEELLEDDDVSEIMVNDWQTIYIERKGKLLLSGLSFISDKQLMRVIERIVAPLGRRIDISSPMVDARLKDGSRVNIIIPPLAPKGSIITIRKFAREALTIDDLVKFGTINRQVIEFLNAAVKSKLNVIISGGTGTGKTTLLNILSSFIPADERVATVEDSAELQLRQPHVLTLEARPPNIEGKGEITIRDLVKNALRMRPDRIVVGECRSGEALDMLQAMNTGHDGSMTTIHANSCREMLTRLETLVMYAGTELPSRAIREQIRGAVDVVLQVTRFKDGSRKVTQISEVIGISDQGVKYEDVFVYHQTGVDENGKILGEFVSTGYVPRALERFAANGLGLPKEMFWAQ